MIASEVRDDVNGTAEEHAMVRRQLERVLAHSSFRNSPRRQAFLRYVVDEKLQGNGLYLKERMIGISVFHQSLDYDTNANSVVRVTAGEVRRRLAQYYVEAHSEDEILIELPLGSYVPELRPCATLASLEVTSPEPQQEVLTKSQEATESTFQVADAVTHTRKSIVWRFKVPIGLLGCALLVGAVVIALVRGPSSTSESDRIWAGAFDGENAVLCAGPLDRVSNSPLKTQERPKHSGFSFTTAKTVAVIGAAIGHAGGGASLLPAEDTTIEELQRSPAVLIGAFNNEWTMRLQSPLRFQFFLSPQGSANSIIDIKEPNSKRLFQNDHNTRDYGIFAHFKSPTTGQSTVIAAGLGMHGTAAVRIFLSSPELLKAFSRSAPAGWEKGNYEIVLASDLVNDRADPPQVLNTYFW